MDLIKIAEKMLRHKLALLPVIALTALGAVYVIAVKPSVYDTSSNYILLSPPAPPTAAQIASDPALGRISSNNPYMDFGDLSVVANLVAQIMSTDAVKAPLIREGANPAYTVAPSAQFGLTTPILQISGVGPTPQAAIQTVNLVGQAVIKQMDTLQASQSVNPHYYIRPSQFTAPNTPQLQVSSKLRMIIGILAIGTILTFVVLSVMTGLEERNQLRRLKEPQLWVTDAVRDEAALAAVPSSADWSAAERSRVQTGGP